MFGMPYAYLAMTLEASPDQRAAAANHFRRLLPLTQVYVDTKSPRYVLAHWLHARALLGLSAEDQTHLADTLAIAEAGLGFVQRWQSRWEEPSFCQ